MIATAWIGVPRRVGAVAVCVEHHSTHHFVGDERLLRGFMKQEPDTPVINFSIIVEDFR